LPEAAKGSPFGPNIHALAVYLKSMQLFSYERLRLAFFDLFGLKISEGALKADQLLLALRRGPDYDQHAFRLRLHARLEIGAVGPQIDIAARGEVPILPVLIFVLPLALQPRNDRRRERLSLVSSLICVV